MHRTLVALVGLIAVAAAQSCGQTPIKPNLFVGAAFPPANNKTGQAVTGGTTVNAYSWPWTVAICTYDFWGNCNFQCAGSIISSQWILTSASYVAGSTKIKDYRVQSGVFDESNKKEPTEQFMEVQAIYVHPQYDGNHNDIALIQLKSPLRFDQFTQPVCLPSNDNTAVAAGQYQWFTGWGYTTNYQLGNPTKQLQQAQLYIDPLNVCQNYYKDPIWDTQLCVGAPQKTTCNYDLGGPLMQANSAGTWYQYGISSYRAKSCDAVCMRTAVFALSTLAVALAATCGQTPIKPDLAHFNTKISNAIVGGDEAIPYSWPWQVVWCSKSWLSDKICSLECGGSVVAPGWIMTSGQCVYNDRNPKNYKVKAGVFDEAMSDEDAEQVVTVKAIHLHPSYNPLKNKDDIALIELDTPLVYGDHVQPVCLPKTDDKALTYPEDLWVTGWGTTKEQGAISRKLRQADVPIVDLPTCEKEYPTMIYEEVEFCAGKQGVDSCKGDIGGPAVSRDTTGAWFQYGIVSWSKGCAEKGEAGIYSRVSAYCNWIKTVTNSTVQCQDVL